MIKSLIPTLSKEVGRSTALVFQQLYQWFKSNEVVYRTNQEISDDLEGILSVTTVQRAKQKLIDAGYLTISFDKGLKRTTHYRLTQKARDMLDAFNGVVKKVEAVAKAVVPAIAKKKPVSVPAQDNSTGLASTKSMKEAFEEYGKAPKGAIAMPEQLRKLILGTKKSAPIADAVVNKPVSKPVGGSVFKSVVNEAQQRIYDMKLQNATFKEDY